MLADDVALVQALQWQIEQKLLNDWLILPQPDGNLPAAKRLRQIILKRAKDRAYSLLDLDRRLPFSQDSVAEIGRFFSLVQDRNAEGFATDMEHALINAKTYVDNPNLAFERGPILEEIISLGNQLLASLDGLPFSLAINRLMQELMRDLGRAQDQLATVRQSLQAEFHSHRELVRHINNAIRSAQTLLNELSNSRATARIRLRINALQRSLELLQSYSDTAVAQQNHSRRHLLQLLNILIDLYVDMAILDSRSSQQSTALEGIRIIRESAAV
jgi:hypothetical protein